MDVVLSLISWGKSAQMCSPMSQTFLFTIICSSLTIASGGVYVWRKYIRKQPGDGLQKGTETKVDSSRISMI